MNMTASHFINDSTGPYEGITNVWSGRVSLFQRLDLLLGALSWTDDVPVCDAGRAAFSYSIAWPSTDDEEPLEWSDDHAQVVALAVAEPEVVASVPGTLEALHRFSGLTWEELAALLDVSRRSLHHWMRGTKVSSRNQHRLRRVFEVLKDLDMGDSTSTRERILGFGQRGISPYQALLGETSSIEPVEGFYPGELLGAGVPLDTE